LHEFKRNLKNEKSKRKSEIDKRRVQYFFKGNFEFLKISDRKAHF
jgi:hypothetical protein